MLWKKGFIWKNRNSTTFVVLLLEHYALSTLSWKLSRMGIFEDYLFRKFAFSSQFCLVNLSAYWREKIRGCLNTDRSPSGWYICFCSTVILVWTTQSIFFWKTTEKLPLYNLWSSKFWIVKKVHKKKSSQIKIVTP